MHWSVVASLHEPGAATAISFGYDANGNRTQITYPTGASNVDPVPGTRTTM